MAITIDDETGNVSEVWLNEEDEKEDLSDVFDSRESAVADTSSTSASEQPTCDVFNAKDGTYEGETI